MSDQVRFGRVQLHRDERGTLGVLDFAEVPFTPRRVFWITGVPSGLHRAGHGHYVCHQFLLCEEGGVEATVRTPQRTVEEFRLESGTYLYIPPMNWLDLRNFESPSCLAVLASHSYDPDDYVTDLDEIYGAGA
jgi:UDP-2-acetamido-3-amino-2,3-dideoxy-glucuronate N-acetyltransferase